MRLQRERPPNAMHLAGQLDKNAQTDKMLVGAGAVLFWPALFFVGGTADAEAEYGHVKGEVQALESARVQNNCSAPAANQATQGRFIAY